jgi:NAD(P)H-hydrate repair Nnr-like enzyme with NAD(P)H-hydrate dehydratase domain
VLTGIIGALMATNSNSILNRKFDLASIAATASLIHQSAAKLAISEGPITSSDVARKISRAIFEIIK